MQKQFGLIKSLLMRGFIIFHIIKVVFEDILMELYFNIEKEGIKKSFVLSIGDDGETIEFRRVDNWINTSDINYEAFLTIQVNKNNDELSILIGDEITDVKIGEGTLDDNKNVVYYFMMETSNNKFLFFNNGDNGAFSFDKIEEILVNDIYGYQWVQQF